MEGVGDGLATASRHAAFSTFAYARFSDRTTGKLVPILGGVYRLVHSSRGAVLVCLRVNWKEESIPSCILFPCYDIYKKKKSINLYNRILIDF